MHEFAFAESEDFGTTCQQRFYVRVVECEKIGFDFLHGDFAAFGDETIELGAHGNFIGLGQIIFAEFVGQAVKFHDALQKMRIRYLRADEKIFQRVEDFLVEKCRALGAVDEIFHALKNIGRHVHKVGMKIFSAVAEHADFADHRVECLSSRRRLHVEIFLQATHESRIKIFVGELVTVREPLLQDTTALHKQSVLAEIFVAPKCRELVRRKICGKNFFTRRGLRRLVENFFVRHVGQFKGKNFASQIRDQNNSARTHGNNFSTRAEKFFQRRDDKARKFFAGRFQELGDRFAVNVFQTTANLSAEIQISYQSIFIRRDVFNLQNFLQRAFRFGGNIFRHGNFFGERLRPEGEQIFQLSDRFIRHGIF